MGMTATERLRVLLDERGVEWETRIEIDTGIEHIIWHPTELSQWDWNEEFGAGWLTGWQQGVTPEQAIAATLGDSDTTGARQRDAVEVVRCRDCACFSVDDSDHDYRTGWWCKRWDTDMVMPDGFCAWASRKENE